jgi:hypothetical protein
VYLIFFTDFDRGASFAETKKFICSRPTGVQLAEQCDTPLADCDAAARRDEQSEGSLSYH